MNSTITSWAVELRREESRRRLQDLVRPPQLPDLLLELAFIRSELADALRVRAGDAVVDVGLA